MKIFHGRRKYFYISQTGIIPHSSVDVWLVGRRFKSWWAFEEGRWEHIKDGLAAQMFLFGVDDGRESSLLELLTLTGQTINDIPMTKWDKIIDCFQRVWGWIKRLGVRKS